MVGEVLGGGKMAYEMKVCLGRWEGKRNKEQCKGNLKPSAMPLPTVGCHCPGITQLKQIVGIYSKANWKSKFHSMAGS